MTEAEATAGQFLFGPEGHKYYVSKSGKGFRTHCQCSATWTHGEQATPEDIESLHGSHVAYFKRPALQLL